MSRTDRDKAELADIYEQKKKLTHNQELYLAVIETKMKAAEVNVLGSIVALTARDEANANPRGMGAYVPSKEINSLYSSLMKAERDIERRKASLANLGFHIDEMTNDRLTELIAVAERKKLELANTLAALKDKIAMNERAAALLAIEIAECIDAATEPTLSYRI